MAYKRVLTIQDISCVGQCSLTVALPVISACGVETCVLPSAVLSTHTGGFTDPHFRDLTEDMGKICDHWVREGLRFDAICSGYLGSVRQIDSVKTIMDAVAAADCVRVVDPAMADHGKLYRGFDMDFVEHMKSLAESADYLIPNITEAAMLSGMEYRDTYDEAYIRELTEKLLQLGCRNLIVTGVAYEEGKTGVLVVENGVSFHYVHEKVCGNCHGTGDIFASAFIGALMRGKTAFQAAKIAADYVTECIRCTAQQENHRYGAAFEPVLGKLIEMLK